MNKNQNYDQFCKLAELLTSHAIENTEFFFEKKKEIVNLYKEKVSATDQSFEKMLTKIWKNSLAMLSSSADKTREAQQRFAETYNEHKNEEPLVSNILNLTKNNFQTAKSLVSESMSTVIEKHNINIETVENFCEEVFKIMTPAKENKTAQANA